VPADGGPPPPSPASADANKKSPVGPGPNATRAAKLVDEPEEEDEPPSSLLKLLAEHLSLSLLAKSRVLDDVLEARSWDKVIVGHLSFCVPGFGKIQRVSGFLGRWRDWCGEFTFRFPFSIFQILHLEVID
jgi:hypothetical protein